MPDYYTFRVPDTRKPGKTRLTRYKMTVQVAEERYPGAVPEPGTKEVWNETGDLHATFAVALAEDLRKRS